MPVYHEENTVCRDLKEAFRKESKIMGQARLNIPGNKMLNLGVIVVNVQL